MNSFYVIPRFPQSLVFERNCVCLAVNVVDPNVMAGHRMVAIGLDGPAPQRKLVNDLKRPCGGRNQVVAVSETMALSVQIEKDFTLISVNIWRFKTLTLEENVIFDERIQRRHRVLPLSAEKGDHVIVARAISMLPCLGGICSKGSLWINVILICFNDIAHVVLQPRLLIPASHISWKQISACQILAAVLRIPSAESFPHRLCPALTPGHRKLHGENVRTVILRLERPIRPRMKTVLV